MLEKARFAIEGLEGTFEGWHDPLNLWNGFANPLLGREESERLATALSAHVDGEFGYSVEFDPLEDVFRVTFTERGVPEGVDDVLPAEIDGLGHLYDWGHGWCWLEERISG
jgi:hypothetical protein